MGFAAKNQMNDMSHGERFALPLGHPLCSDAGRSGGKGSRLAKMIQSGYPVPPGFVVTVDAFREFCRRNQIVTRTDRSSSIVAKRIVEGTLPESVQNAIREAVGTMPAGPLAVRSSALSEDGADHSMAGQYDTFLSVAHDDVAQRVQACWAGLFNAAATSYVRKNAMREEPKMAVVVQQQVDPVYAGVLFTLDPLDRSTDRLVVEWVEGLAEKLVSGDVTPERAYVNRTSLVPDRALPPLLEDNLESLCQLALKAEGQFGHPADLEWCIDASGVKLVQSRPITALTSAETVIWTNVNMTENFPAPLSPFTWSVVDRFYEAYMRSLLRMLDPSDELLARLEPYVKSLTGVHQGRVYYNLSSWYGFFGHVPFGGYLRKFLDHYIGQRIPLSKSIEDETRETESLWRKGWIHAEFLGRLAWVESQTERRLGDYEKRFHAFRDSLRQQPYEKKSLSQLTDDLGATLEFVTANQYAPGTGDLLVMIYPSLLEKFVRRALPKYTSADVVKLFQGLRVRSTEPTKIMWDLAHAIPEDGDLQALLQQGDFDALEGRLPTRWRAELDRFMHEFGGRCFNECMITSPTFEENHGMFWDLVRRYQSATCRSPDEIENDEEKQRLAFTGTIERELGFVRAKCFRVLLARAQKAVRLREVGRIYQSLLFGEVRHVVMAIGSKLSAKGIIEKPEDVFFLYGEEIFDFVHGRHQFPRTIAEIVALRQQAHREAAEHEPPELFLLDKGEIYDPGRRRAVSGLQGSEIVGVGVSAGTTRAKTRVILDPTTDHGLEPGEILVTRTTDPGWTPLFLLAGGLVLEKGGLLSHAAIVAREFGIPCVVGVENATKLLATGTEVTVDGGRGHIGLV